MSEPPTAPFDWYYAGFPLDPSRPEELALDDVVRRALELTRRAENSDPDGVLGQVLHWAHLLKVEIREDGVWPARVNARTGAQLGAERTRAPLELLARLNDLLQSTEFDVVPMLTKRSDEDAVLG